MNNLGSPPTLAQVEDLILNLYQANRPEVIASTQTALTQLQSSPEAWSIARDLLTRPDEKVRFHGALIIIIKLNTESDTLSDESAQELLLNLIGWYIQSCSRDKALLVTRKLASALATFLIHFHHLWAPFVRHLAVCLASGEPVNLEAAKVGLLADISHVLESLDSIQLRAVLWVAANAVEEASKLDLNAAKSIGLYNIICQNASDTVALISRAILAQPRVLEDSIKCLQAWIWFAQKTSTRNKSFVDALRPLVTLVIESLASQNPAQESIELLTDVLSNYSGLLTEEHYSILGNILNSQQYHQYYSELVGGDFDFDTLQYGQLLLAFGDARVDILMQSGDDQSRSILSMLCGLLNAKGYPSVEDKIFVPALEFWSTFSETVTDETYSSEQSSLPWAASAIGYVFQAVSNAWQKIAYPTAEELSHWDSSDRLSFNDARKDVADLLQSTYTLSGPRLVFTFADLILESLSTASWLRLEAAVFCLGALADYSKEDVRSDEALSSIFSSALFQTLQDHQANIPSRTRQSCVSLIEYYTEYFERNLTYLPSALTLLFGLVGDSTLATAASKSILQLCSSCRRHLSFETGAFLDEYQKLSRRGLLDCLSSERLLGGIACVAQALPSQEDRFSACVRLLEFVAADVSLAMDCIRLLREAGISCPAGARCLDDAGQEYPALHFSLKALRSLAAIGRGFQSPTDVSIDLEATTGTQQDGDAQLAKLHHEIFSMMLRLQNSFQDNSDITEIICSILRCGFSESSPGMFVFAREDVSNFLTKHNVNTPRIGVLVSTGCSFISSFKKSELSEHNHLLGHVLIWVISLVQQLSEPEQDPELVQNAIEFISRLISKNASVFIQLQPPEMMEFCFLFTLRVLDGREPLPKAAATDFWATFISLNDETTPGLKDRVSQAMYTLGPLLCESLARNIGGNAARSELDKLAEPIKKMVSRYPETKLWLEAGLNHPSFPSSKISPQQKAVFLKKLLSLRGSRQTNQVIRDFWLAARGSNFAYAS